MDYPVSIHQSLELVRVSQILITQEVLLRLTWMTKKKFDDPLRPGPHTEGVPTDRYRRSRRWILMTVRYQSVSYEEET